MNRDFFLPRILSLFLTLTLGLPHLVFGLRQTIEGKATSGLEEVLTEAGPSTEIRTGLEEDAPGQGIPAHPNARRRSQIVGEILRNKDYPTQWIPLLSRFLAGEQGLTFDEAREKLVELSAQHGPSLTHDQAREILFQIWVWARFRLNDVRSELLLHFASRSFSWDQFESRFLVSRGRRLRPNELNQILYRSKPLENRAGIVQPDLLAIQLSQLLAQVKDEIARGNWDSVSERLIQERFYYLRLAVFSLLAAPGEERLETEQLVELGRRVISAVVVGPHGRRDPPPLISANLLDPALRNVLLEQFDEPIPNEVQEAALLGGSGSAVAQENLAAISGLALSEALFRALPSGESETTKIYRPVAYEIEEMAWLGLAVTGVQGNQRMLRTLWKPDELYLYSDRKLGEEQAVREILETAQKRSFRELIFQRQAQPLAEFDLPLDPDETQQVAALVSRLIARSTTEPKAVHLSPQPPHLIKGRPSALVVYPAISAGLEAGSVTAIPEPPSAMTQEEARQVVESFAQKWRLTELSKPWIAAVSPELVRDNPKLQGLIGQPVPIGQVWFVIVPSDPEQIGKLSLELIGQFQKEMRNSITVQGYGAPDDEAINLFEKETGTPAAGFTVLGRRPLIGSLWVERFQGIIANLAGVEPDAIDPEDLAALIFAVLT